MLGIGLARTLAKREYLVLLNRRNRRIYRVFVTLSAIAASREVPRKHNARPAAGGRFPSPPVAAISSSLKGDANARAQP
jgi:hypothetical protein